MKDYAKRSWDHKKPRSRKKNGMKVMMIILGAILILAMVYFMHHKKTIHPQASVVKPQQTKTILAVAAPTKPKEPTFDFYTMLPKMGLPTNAGRGKYFLQIAAVQRQAKAEVVKNQLFKMGYAVSVQNYKIEGTHWYRVLVGPYQVLKTAQNQQKKLKRKQFPSLLLTVKSKQRK